MSQFNFGTGILTLIPSGSNPTPVKIGTLQDVSLDISFAEKELRGQLQLPVDIARGAGKISGKAKSGQFSSALYKAVLSGATGPAAGSKIGIHEESGTIPGTPYTITVAQGATFYEDLGVMNSVTGLYMSRVASAPTTGQYSVNTTTGVYTFAAADTTVTVKISYSYTSTTVGFTTSFTNQLMGTGTTFTLTVYSTYKTLSSGFRLWSVSMPKLSMALKNEDYTMHDLDFSAAADSTGRIIDVYTAE